MSVPEKILKMVAEGKISAEEGEKLLIAVKQTARNRDATAEMQKYSGSNKQSQNLKGKIVIDIQNANHEGVKINLPLKLANLAGKIVPRDRLNQMENEGFNVREILSNISKILPEGDDDIVNITSSSGDRVRIYVERH